MLASPLQQILASYRATSQTEREKGSYFEELIRTYFRYEASYADLYSQVWLFADWAKEVGTPEFGISAKDTGIDLVAKTRGTEEYHAIQCKCYDEHHRIMRRDIDSFFTASGREPCSSSSHPSIKSIFRTSKTPRLIGPNTSPVSPPRSSPRSSSACIRPAPKQRSASGSRTPTVGSSSWPAAAEKSSPN